MWEDVKSVSGAVESEQGYLARRRRAVARPIHLTSGAVHSVQWLARFCARPTRLRREPPRRCSCWPAWGAEGGARGQAADEAPAAAAAEVDREMRGAAPGCFIQTIQ